MKKKFLFLSFFLFTSFLLFGGGIVTNTNQSATWVRMPSRNASLGLDAAYFNPAGLGLLPSNGFFVSLSNQVISQKRTITSSYPLLNSSKYEGDVLAPLFPSIYAGYKADKYAVSFGFFPIGGGGGATYNKGIPSFEYALTDLVPALSARGVSDYNADIFFEGSSVFFGYQLNFTYKISDLLSVAIGGRLVTAKETYAGHLNDIRVNYNGTWTPANLFLSNLSMQASSGAASASGAATTMQPLVDGAGSLTFQQAQDAMIIDAVTRGQLEGGLTALGINPAGMTIAQAQTAYQAAAGTLSQTAVQTGAQAKLLRNQEADVEKTGMGFTPIISLNFHPSEKLNIALKYEHNTKLELENITTKDITRGYTPTGDSITQFPNGAIARNDIPTTISGGISYQVIEKLQVSAGFYYYADKQADWEGRQDSLKSNSYELMFGLEYNITDKLIVSGGYQYTRPGTQDAFQNDLSFYVPSSTIGFGFGYKLNEKIELNVGGSYTGYQNGDKDFTRNTLNYTETYDKSTFVVGLGLNVLFGK